MYGCLPATWIYSTCTLQDYNTDTRIYKWELLILIFLKKSLLKWIICCYSILLRVDFYAFCYSSIFMLTIGYFYTKAFMCVDMCCQEVSISAHWMVYFAALVCQSEKYFRFNVFFLHSIGVAMGWLYRKEEKPEVTLCGVAEEYIVGSAANSNSVPLSKLE